MKTRTILAGLTSLVAGLAGAFAQTAVTDPVGYITINVAAKASGSAITPIAPTLVNKVDFAGAIATIDATTITVSGTPFTTNSFSQNVTTYGTFPRYYVEITNGAGEGAWTNITGNTTSGITTADDMTAFAAAGSTIKIRAHVTVNQFFGATNTAGLKPGDDAGIADEVYIVDASANKTTTIFFEPSTPSWYDAEFNDAGILPIEPQQGLLVKHKTATAVNFVNVGHVKTGKTLLGVFAGLNVTAVPRATGVTFTLSNLYTGNNATGLRKGDDGGIADEVFVYTNGNPVSYFNDGTTWFDAEFNDAGGVNLKEGTAIVIKRKLALDFNWAVPAQPIAN